MATISYYYVYLKPLMVQSRDEAEAKAQALRMIRTGFPCKICGVKKVVLKEDECI